jgi:hypothetical protein
MTIDEAEKILGVQLQQKVYRGKTKDVIITPDESVTAFCKNGKVYSVLIKAPFSGDVRGIHIGDSKEKVKSILGEPIEVMDIPEAEMLMYDEEKYFRVDINKENNNTVDRIYV